MSKILVSILIITAICISASCEDPVRTTLNEPEKKMLDSLYAKQASYVRRQTDSICDARYKLIFDQAADSFYQEYFREIQDIIYGEG